MTTANPQHARDGGLSGAWRGFRQWRRNRPFWGGLLTTIAGAEIFITTQASLGDLTFQMGPTGYLSWLIPAVLIACGMLMWFTPQQRMFYAVVAVVTAVFSLIGVNLGGFFIGMLLGLVGGALGFAWVPPRVTEIPVVDVETAPDATATPEETAAADDDTLVTEIVGSDDTRQTTPAAPQPRDEPDGAPQRTANTSHDPRTLAGVLVLALAATALLALPSTSPAQAAAPTGQAHRPGRPHRRPAPPPGRPTRRRPPPPGPNRSSPRRRTPPPRPRPRESRRRRPRRPPSPSAPRAPSSGASSVASSTSSPRTGKRRPSRRPRPLPPRRPPPPPPRAGSRPRSRMRARPPRPPRPIPVRVPARTTATRTRTRTSGASPARPSRASCWPRSPPTRGSRGWRRTRRC